MGDLFFMARPAQSLLQEVGVDRKSGLTTMPMSDSVPTSPQNRNRVAPRRSPQVEHFKHCADSVKLFSAELDDIQDQLDANIPTGPQVNSRPKPAETSSEPLPTVLNPQQVSVSHTYREIQYWKPSLDRDSRAHLRNLCQEPHNPKLASGQPRFLYSAYAIKPSTTQAIDEYIVKSRSHLRDKKNVWANAVIEMRLMKFQGLREWEWAMGEPEITDDNNTHSDVEVDEPAMPITYAQRVKAFTYTFGDDPLMKGRKYVRHGRRGFRALSGHFPNEVSCADQGYVPVPSSDVNEEVLPRSLVIHSGPSSEVASTQEIAAEDFLSTTESRELTPFPASVDEGCMQGTHRKRKHSGSGCSKISAPSTTNADE